MQIRSMNGSRLFDLANVVFLLAVVLVTVYPLYYVLIISLSDGNMVMRGIVHWFPRGFSFRTYEVIFQDPTIIRSYLNTFLYTSVGTMINLLMTSFCAYPLSRQDLWGRRVFTALIVFTMFFDGGLIPKFLVVHSLGMLDTMWAIVIPGAINVWYMVLMRTFFQNIPEALHESARMDGAGETSIFFRIVAPLSVPVFATMVLFYAVGHWNSFFSALIYLNDPSKYPVQMVLRSIVIQGEMSEQAQSMGGGEGLKLIAENIKYGVIIVAIVPILAVYPYLQRYFVKGVMVGSLKG